MRTIGVRVPVDVYERVAARAELEGVSVSEYVRRLLDAPKPWSDPTSDPLGDVKRVRKTIEERPESTCKHKWVNKGYAVVCEHCKDVRR